MSLITGVDHQRYELLIRSVLDYAIFMLDPDGHIVTWNKGAEQIKGYREEEIIGRHFSIFYTDEDRAKRLPDTILRTVRREGRFRCEGWRRKKDGSLFFARVAIHAVRDGDELVGFAKITRDITDQREAQRRALEAERRFRLLVEGVTDYAIFMIDPNGCVANWNAGAERIKGYGAAEVLGSHFSRFYTDEDRAAGLPEIALEAARRDGRYESEGWRCRKDGGRFWASAIIDAIYDERGELIGFAKITRDLSERRAAQITLEQSREQLFQAQKMEAVGQLTGGLAHDFNNLLSAIMGSLEIMRRRLRQGRAGEIERQIDSAEQAAARASALTHRMLAFARRQALIPVRLDVNMLLRDMQDLFLRALGPHVSLRQHLDTDLWPTFCDGHQLENALLNLCLNGRDAMLPDGGVLTITTGNEKGAACDYVVIEVADTGAGMSAEVAARAFDPFFTTKPVGAGTGLGLSMVYGFADQSGGRVDLDSAPGKGTRVRLKLPRAPAS